MTIRPTTAAVAVALIALAAGCRPSSRGSDLSGMATPDSSALLRDIGYLSSNELEGRATGTAGNDSAAKFIARRFQALGLAPLFCDTSAAPRIPAGSAIGAANGDSKPTTAATPRAFGQGCRGTYFQRFNTRSIAAAHAGINTQLATQNVVAVLRGTDPKLREQFVVVGAHHDHLGRMGFGVLDVDSASAIHNGADDNASGTAAVLELARLLARRPAARSIIFMTFSGEELGLLGSQYFVEHSPVPIDSMVAMLNFDMVGRLKDDRLIVYGAATADEFPGLLDSANTSTRLQLSVAGGDGFGSSDHSSFYAKGLPVLHFFTDLHPDYHRSTDDVERINAGGEARVIALAEQVLRGVANRPARLTPRRPAAVASRTSACRSNASLGTIPNMGATDVAGLQLSGVREGSPGAKGGLKAGDVVVEFGGKTIKDLYDYTDALCSHNPGDTVSIIVLRNGERVTLSVTLGRRGG